MSVESLIGDCEAALVRLISLGLSWRYPAKANLTALAAMDVVVLTDGALCYVTSEGAVYEWLAYSTTAPSSPNVIAANSPPTGKSNGRWHKVVTDWTYGAGGTNLGAKATGYLKAVAAYSTDDGPDTAIEMVFGKTPSVLVQFTGDTPKSDSGLRGSFYKTELAFQLLIITANLRGRATATQGPPTQLTDEASTDPGAYQIIGGLRRLLCGVSGVFGVTGVERVEIGPSSLAFEDYERRLFVWTMGVTIRASFQIEDEDLEDAAIRLQPALTENWPALTWDKDNYISRGGGLDEGAGAGLSRTIDETIAKVGSTAVSAAAQLVTFTAERDTYRDLSPAGVWTFTAVAVGASQPPLVSGRLRVAVTRTDASGIVGDMALCSFSIPYGEPFDVP
jgi:phage gp37-like protein